ncbi:MAG: class I adenylate-forming enzyme family protein [Nitrospinota bacterium]
MSSSRILPPYFRPSLQYPDYPFHGLLRTSFDRSPDRVALVDGKKELTFRELEGLSNACAHALGASGVGKADRVALFLFNSAEFEIAFFGASKIGAILTPLNPSFKESEAHSQLQDSGAKLLVVHESRLPVIEAIRGELPDLREVIAVSEGEGAGGYTDFRNWIAAHAPSAPPEVPIDPREDLIALPYSSGTTGLPKGVMLTHRNLVSNYVQFVASHRITERDSGLVFLPLYHIYGTMIMGGLVLAGAPQVLMRRFEVEEALRLVEQHRLTVFHGVPPALLAISQFADLDKYDLSSLRYIMSGAAPLPPEVRRRVQERTGVLTFMGYGLTEASPLTHLNPPVEEWVKEASVGPPVSDEEQKVVDTETGEKELPPGEVGELVLRGPHIMKGYWNAPEETALALRDGWLYTGDIVRVDEDGYAFILDRQKEMIKYKGFAVAPAELEALLHRHPQVADVAVIGKENSEAGEIPKAFIVPTASSPPDPGEIMAFVRERVAGYKQVRDVEFIDAIPKSGSGKILRRVLRQREKERGRGQVAS